MCLLCPWTPLEALETLAPGAPKTLTNPFGWNLTEQYKDFQLCIKSGEQLAHPTIDLRTRRMALRMTPSWNTCCTSWVTLNGRSMDAGSLQVTYPPLSSRSQRAQSFYKWSTLAQLWARRYPNDVEFTNWRTSGSSTIISSMSSWIAPL